MAHGWLITAPLNAYVVASSNESLGRLALGEAWSKSGQLFLLPVPKTPLTWPVFESLLRAYTMVV